MKQFLYFCFLVSVVQGAALAQPTHQAGQGDDLGVIVMAHGGSAAWNEGVLGALASLRNDYRVETAFGMADAGSLQESVAKLEAEGAQRIAVVRLFVSRDSWYARTRQILGLAEGAPERPDGSSAGREGHPMAFWRLETDASFAMSREGLAEAPEMTVVLADRARALSRDPLREDVLILAHGPEDDEENERWLRAIGAHAAVVRESLPFHDVRVETLREDWPRKRKRAEQRIRRFARTAAAQGRRLIVIPYRVHGFGPYAEVLEPYDYAADQRGLVPHPQVTAWIRRQIETLAAGPFSRPD